MQEPSSSPPELSDVEHGESSVDIGPGCTATGQPLAQETNAEHSVMQETSAHLEQSDVAPGRTTTGKPLEQATDGDGKYVTTLKDPKEKKRGSSLSLLKRTFTDKDNEKIHSSTVTGPAKYGGDRSPPGEHSVCEDFQVPTLKGLAEKEDKTWFRTVKDAKTKDGQFHAFTTEKEKIVCHPEDQLPAIDAQTPAKRVQCKTRDSCRHIAIENDDKEVYISKAEFGPKADDVPSDLDRLRAREQQAHPLEQFHPPVPWSLTEYHLITLLKCFELYHLEAICVGKGYKQHSTGSINTLLRWEQRKRRPKDKLVYIKIETTCIESGQVEYLLTEYGKLERLAAGDLIVFRRFYGLYDHYAVYIGEGLVVHLILEVKEETLFDILDAGSQVRIESGSWNGIEPLPVPDIIEKALSKIGTKGYHLFKYNCEHFARECRYGQPGSKQVDNLRPRFTRL